MSKKYVIEIKPEYEDKFKGVMILGAENGNLYVDSSSVEELEELNSDYINEHFSDLQDTAYQKGFEDGKAVNEKGCGGCKYAGKVVTGPPCITCCNSYKNQWTAKSDKIEVGDEVKNKSDSITWTAVVTKNDDGMLTLMGRTGAIADDYDEKNFVKTGRHFDIEKILEAMKE